MATFSHRDARRDFLKNVGFKLAAAAPLAMPFGASHAGRASKSDFFFQERPKDGKRCADCRLFMRDSSDPNLGTCTVIEGVINANGWCMAYTPK
jgi:hypothetical protein